MHIQVITPPAPFVTPADIAGDHAANDPKIVAMIAAATEEIDGYTGWLGRCLAPQLLEYSARPHSARFSLPIGPVLAIESITIEDHGGVETILQADSYRLYDGEVGITSWLNWPGYRVRRVRYWAGYGVRDADNPTQWTQQVPQRAKQAVVLMVQHMKSLGAENLFLRTEEVEGIGTSSYTVSDQAGTLIEGAVKSLLSGLKVRRV